MRTKRTQSSVLQQQLVQPDDEQRSPQEENPSFQPSQGVPFCPLCGLLMSPIGVSYYVCDHCGYRRGRGAYCTCKYPLPTVRGMSFTVVGEEGVVCMRCLLPFELIL